MVSVLVRRQRSQNAGTRWVPWAFEPASPRCHSSSFCSPELMPSGACSFLARLASGGGIHAQMFLGRDFNCLVDVPVYHVYHLNRGYSLLFKTKITGNST